MKSTIFLFPVAFLSMVLAWGKEAPAAKVAADASVEPAANRRYEYKQSLKKPFMYNGALPFWDQHGSKSCSVLLPLFRFQLYFLFYGNMPFWFNDGA